MSYLHVLHEYLNGSLRDQLNFREKYSFPFLNDDKNIIYFTKDSTPNFDLKGMLTSNKELVIKLKQTFKEFLLREIEERNITEVKLLIDDKPGKRGIGIIIIQEQVEMIDVNPYVEIISHFDTAEQIDNYCKSNKTTMSICKRKELWRGLVKKVYPFKYKHEHNYEKLYKQYLLYKTYQIDKLTGLPIRVGYHIVHGSDGTVRQTINLNPISEMINFLILENLIDRQYFIYYLKFAIVTQNQKIVDEIRRNWTVEDPTFEEYITDNVEYTLTQTGVGFADKENFIRGFMKLNFGDDLNQRRKMEAVIRISRNVTIIETNILSIIIDNLPEDLQEEFRKEINNN